MSWHFLQEEEEGYWEPDSSVGPPSALLKLLTTPVECCLRASATPLLDAFLSGTTSERSTGVLGLDALMSYLAASRVNRSAEPLVGGTTLSTFGLKCEGSLAKSNPEACSQRTSSEPLSSAPRPIFIDSGTSADSLQSLRPKWVPRIYESDGGLLPTPTATANQDADSMQKHPGCRRQRLWTGGKTTPAHWEFVMGWPIGWTDLQPLETDKFRQWLLLHGAL
jgi:hypothetical protein